MNISFCITSYYKDIHFLDSLLDYISQQTICPFEIIVYVSGIEDIKIPNNILIANQIVPIYKVLSTKKTIQSIARNTCSSIASGDTIIFFDIDDIPHPQKVEATVYHIKNYDFLVHSYSLSFNGFENINIYNMDSDSNLEIDNNSTNIKCGDKNIHHAHIAVKKEVFKKIRFDENQKFYRKEDGKFCQDLLNYGFKGIHINYPLVVYT